MHRPQFVISALLACLFSLFLLSVGVASGLSGADTLRVLWQHSELLQSEVDKSSLRKLLDGKVGSDSCGNIEKYYKPTYRVEWVALKRTHNRVDLRLCPTDDVVHLHEYMYDDGKTLYVIASESGASHETWRYEFWTLGKGGSLVKVSQNQLGLSIPRNNDFLRSGPFFLPAENHKAKLYFDENDGTFVAEPDFSGPEWEDRKVEYQFHYIWNGKKFQIQKNSLGINRSNQ